MISSLDMLALLLPLSLAFSRDAKLSLVKTVFTGARTSSVLSGGLVVDVAGVNMDMRDCRMNSLGILGSAVHLQSGHFLVRDSTFDTVDGRLLYFEEADHYVVNETEGETVTGQDFDMRVIVKSGSSLTCENCKFVNIVGAYVGTHDKNGGAIFAAGGSTKLNCTQCEFDNCSMLNSGSDGGIGWGDAVFCKAPEFVFDYCTVKNIKSKWSIIHHLGAETFTEMNMTGCKFENVGIIAPEGTVEDDIQCGGSGIELKNLQSFGLIECEFTTVSHLSGWGGVFRPWSDKNDYKLFLIDSKFSHTWAKFGGCIAIRLDNRLALLYVSGCSFLDTRTTGSGGVFLFTGAPKATSEIIILDTVIEAPNASEGYCLMAGPIATPRKVQTGSFVMVNVTLRNTDFESPIHTMMHIETAAPVLSNIKIEGVSQVGTMYFSGVTNTTFELHDAVFENVGARDFFFQYEPVSNEEVDAVSKSMTLTNCRFSETDLEGWFSSSGLSTVTFTSCTINRVKNILFGGSGTSASTSFIMDGGVISDVPQSDTLFQFGEGSVDAKFKKVSFENFNGILGSFMCTGEVALDTITLANAPVPRMTVRSCNKFLLSGCAFVDAKFSGSYVFTVDQCNYLEIVNSDFNRSTETASSSTALFKLAQASGSETPMTINNNIFDNLTRPVFELGAGNYKIETCCFTSAEPYITVTTGAKVAFNELTCFDTAESQAIVLAEGVQPTWDDFNGTIFECTACSTVEFDTATTAPPPPAKKGLSDGAIAAIVIVVLLVIAAIVVVVILLMLRRRRNEQSSNTSEPGADTADPDEETTTVTQVMDQLVTEEAGNALFATTATNDVFSPAFEERESFIN